MTCGRCRSGESAPRSGVVPTCSSPCVTRRCSPRNTGGHHAHACGRKGASARRCPRTRQRCGANASRSNQWSIRARMARGRWAAAQATTARLWEGLPRRVCPQGGAYQATALVLSNWLVVLRAGLGGAGGLPARHRVCGMARFTQRGWNSPSWHSSRRWGSSSTVVSSRCTASFAMPSEMPRFSAGGAGGGFGAPGAASCSPSAKMWSALVHRRHAGIGQHQVAALAAQQAHAQGFFQFAHLGADGLHRHVQPFAARAMPPLATTQK